MCMRIYLENVKRYLRNSSHKMIFFETLQYIFGPFFEIFVCKPNRDYYVFRLSQNLSCSISFKPSWLGFGR